MRCRRVLVPGGGTLALGLLIGPAACAQTCVVAASGLVFGAYDPFATVAAAITGTVSVTCQAAVSTGIVYSIQIGPGGGSFTARAMAGGAGRLGYQLYTSVARTMVWGDGTSGTGVIGDSYGLSALNPVTRNYTVYGYVPARQLVAPGAYADTVAVMVVY